VKRAIRGRTEEEIENERLAEEEAAKGKKKGKDEPEELKPKVIKYEFFEDRVAQAPQSCDAWLKLVNDTRIYFEIEKYFEAGDLEVPFDQPMEEKFGVQEGCFKYGLAATCTLVNGLICKVLLFLFGFFEIENRFCQEEM
jgi:hypothetical protein